MSSQGVSKRVNRRVWMYSQSVFCENVVEGKNIIRDIVLVNFNSKSKREIRNVIGELEEVAVVFKEQGGRMIEGEQVHDMVHVHHEGTLE